jgi:hypothetical protein
MGVPQVDEVFGAGRRARSWELELATVFKLGTLPGDSFSSFVSRRMLKEHWRHRNLWQQKSRRFYTERSRRVDKAVSCHGQRLRGQSGRRYCAWGEVDVVVESEGSDPKTIAGLRIALPGSMSGGKSSKGWKRLERILRRE